MEAPLFHTSFQAIRFAVTREGTPQRAATSRMLDKTRLDEWNALDAAAQAGMIFNLIEPLGRLAVAVLLANTAPAADRCTCGRPCCAGKKANTFWRESVHVITYESRGALPSGSRLDYSLRAAIVIKIYGGRYSFKDIATEHSVDQETVARHHKFIYRWLVGDRGGKSGQPIEGIETSAWQRADIALRDAGLVE